MTPIDTHVLFEFMGPPTARGLRNELTEKRIPLLGKGGVAAPINEMSRSHVSWAQTGWLVQLPIIGGLNQPPRRCELIVIRRYSPPCTTARRGGCVIKENLAKPPKQTQPGWFSFWIHRKTTPASR